MHSTPSVPELESGLDDGGGERPDRTAVVDSARLRSRVVDANEGIITTAGIVEGFLGAGAETTAVVIAACASMVSGGIALGGVKYAAAAAARDAQRALLEEERRQLELSPEAELAELAAFYEAKGLTADLARQVADELSAGDALVAHAEAEHGIAMGDPIVRPLGAAISSGVAFAAGSAIVLATTVLAPVQWRVPSTFFAVVLSLCIISVILGRWGRVPVTRTLLRTVAVGVVAMLVTLALGSRFDL